MDFATISAFVAGSMAGVASGIMPGIGPVHLLAILYLWLHGWDPIHLAVFYVAYITVSNFVDALSSVYLGIPGEVSAIPASNESRYLLQNQLAQAALELAALGRMVGSVFALMFGVLLVDFLLTQTWIFTSHAQMWLFAITLIAIGLTGKNTLWINLSLMVLGFGIGMIGYNYYFEKNILTWDLTVLHAGLPIIPILMGAYVLPMLWNSITRIKPTMITEQSRSLPVRPYIGSMLRGTGIGWVLGFVPGMSYILGSTAAYNFERWVNRRWPGRNRDQSVSAVVASETASNTGSAAVLIPLFLFGLPIIPSESIIFELMVDSGAYFTGGVFIRNNYAVLLAYFSAACVLGWLLSGPLSRIFFRLVSFLVTNNVLPLLIVIIVGTVISEGVRENQLVLYVLTFTASCVLGWLLRNRDVLPLVFVLVLQNSVEITIYNLIQLYL